MSCLGCKVKEVSASFLRRRPKIPSLFFSFKLCMYLEQTEHGDVPDQEREGGGGRRRESDILKGGESIKLAVNFF